MSRRIELQIARELGQGKDPFQVAEALLAGLDPDLTARGDILAAYHFAYHSGYHLAAIKKMARWVEDDHLVPWGVLLEILALHSIRPDDKLLEALFTGVKGADEVALFDRSHSWDGRDRRFQKMHEEYLQSVIDSHQEKKQMLRDKLQFLKEQRIVVEEEKLLERLLRWDPNDRELQRHQVEFKERWARDILNRNVSPFLEDDVENNGRSFSAEEKAMFVLLNTELEHLLRDRPQRVYDFSLIFYYMQNYEGALALLNQATPSKALDWYEAELLLEAGHYVGCLDKVAQLDNRYSEDPETTFSCAYLRAQALHGLGQTGSALELVRGIVSVRPNYRSAASLLSVWGSGR